MKQPENILPKLIITWDGKKETFDSSIPYIPVYFRHDCKEVYAGCDIHYYGYHAGRWHTVFIPFWFKFAGSVPPILGLGWAAATYPLDTRALLGYCIHDKWYEEKVRDREIGDWILKDFCNATLPEVKENIIWGAVRALGGLFRGKGKK